jgi:hypothetical protein
MRLWDDRSGDCVEVATEEAACERHPEWLLARENVRSPAVVCDECFADAHDRVARLRHGSSGAPVAVWNAESNAEARCLLADGTAVVTQDNGQVCVLKLHNGQRRFSLAEAGALLAHQRKNPRATPPFLAPDSQRASMD